MDYTELSLSNVHYYPPTKVNNRYISKVFYQEGHEEPVPLSIVTPALRAHSEICVSENRCYLILELDRQHEDLYNFLTALDDRNIKVMFENSASWFGKTVPLDWLDDNYTTFIKAARPPQIKVRIPHQNGVPTISVPKIEKGTLVKLVLEYQGIKFLRQQASNLWTVEDIRVIDDDEDIEYDFHRYEDDMGDLMLQELNLTIQEAISKANQSVTQPEPEEDDVVEGGNVAEEEVYEDIDEDVEGSKGTTCLFDEEVEGTTCLFVEADVDEEVEGSKGTFSASESESLFVDDKEVFRRSDEPLFEGQDLALEDEGQDSALEDEGRDLALEDEGQDLALEDEIDSEDLFDNLVDRVIDDIVDQDALDSSSDSGRRRRKKIVVGNRVRII